MNQESTIQLNSSHLSSSLPTFRLGKLVLLIVFKTIPTVKKKNVVAPTLPFSTLFSESKMVSK